MTMLHVAMGMSSVHETNKIRILMAIGTLSLA